MKNIFNEIKAILTSPVNNRLDPLQLFLIVGLVMVSIAAWLIILKYMTAGAAAVIEEVTS